MDASTLNVIPGPWEGAPITAATWRRLYRMNPNPDLRRVLERECPEALDSSEDVEEESLEEVLRDLRRWHLANPNPSLARLIERLEQRIAEEESL